MNKKIETLNNLKLTSPDIVFEYFKDKLSDKKQEYFYTLYLDNNKKIISEKLHYIGTINHSLIHPREIYKEAYLCSASSIILIHNHPSGNITPSKEDISITNNLKEIGKLFRSRMTRPLRIHAQYVNGRLEFLFSLNILSLSLSLSSFYIL